MTKHFCITSAYVSASLRMKNLRNEKEKPLPRSLTAMGLRGDGLREEVVSTLVYYASSGEIWFACEFF